MSMPRDENGQFVSPDDYSGQLRKAHCWIQLGSEREERNLFDPAYSFEAIDGDRHLVGVFIQIYGGMRMREDGFGNIEVSKSAQPALLGDTPTSEPGKVDVIDSDETRSSVIGYAGYRDMVHGANDDPEAERQRITDTKTMYFSADRTWNQGQEIHVHGELSEDADATTARVLLLYTEQ